MALKWIR